jgi:hypothetical protein
MHLPGAADVFRALGSEGNSPVALAREVDAGSRKENESKQKSKAGSDSIRTARVLVSRVGSERDADQGCSTEQQVDADQQANRPDRRSRQACDDDRGDNDVHQTGHQQP